MAVQLIRSICLVDSRHYVDFYYSEGKMIPNFKENLDKMYELHKSKCSDYSGEIDAFANFRVCEKLGICSVEQGILVRMTDKIARINNLLKSRSPIRDVKVTDEKITDTLLDLAVYSIILKSWLDRFSGERLSKLYHILKKKKM